MRDVDSWLRESAIRLLGVYGAWDPWSGGMPTVTESEETALFVVPGVGHGAQLALLPEEVRAEAYGRIEAQLGVSVQEGAGLVGSPAVVRHQRVLELLRAYERATHRGAW